MALHGDQKRELGFHAGRHGLDGHYFLLRLVYKAHSLLLLNIEHDTPRYRDANSARDIESPWYSIPSCANSTAFVDVYRSLISTPTEESDRAACS